MSAQEDIAVGVLLSLWRRGGASTVETLRGDTGAGVAEVSAALEVLGRRGCVVEGSPEGGMVLVRTGIGCWRDVIEAESKRVGRALGARALVYQATASTNDVCWQLAGEETVVVLADEQVAGRGRRGNRWEARAGQSVLMSVRMSGREVSVEALTLLAGLAAAEGVEACGGRPVGIKWPNDVLVDGKKVGGILVETRAAEAGRTNVVIGMGLNVAQAAGDFPGELRERATSLYAATGRQMDRLRVVEAVLGALEARVGLAGSPGAWLGAWKARCAMLGQTMAVQHRGETLRVEVVDVDPLQGLVVRDERGVMRFLSAGVTTFAVA